MNQIQTEIHTHFSRSIKQNKLLYVTLAPSEDNSSPTPVIGTFRGYVEENKVMIGDQVYCQKEIKNVRMYHHSSKIIDGKREDPFSGFSPPTLSRKEQEELEDYFNDWSFRDANF